MDKEIRKKNIVTKPNRSKILSNNILHILNYLHYKLILNTKYIAGGPSHKDDHIWGLVVESKVLKIYAHCTFSQIVKL